MPEITLELVLVGIVVLIVVGRRLLLLANQKKAGAAASGTPAGSGAPAYGLAGGAVCPGCGRAFARSFLSPNLIAGKLCRCPHCGKWSIVPQASPAALAKPPLSRPRRPPRKSNGCETGSRPPNTNHERSPDE